MACRICNTNRMKKRYLLFMILVMGIFLLEIVSAATYCCEKTKQGAWCQNVNSESLCDSNFRKIPAACDATSYCKTGTCVNGQEGTCMPSTQVVCEQNYGFWSEEPKSALPQCQLGCCLIGDQAAFVTQVSCNRMSALYGLQVSWQSNTNNELECLASANPRAKGACVFTKNYAKTCEATTKKDCQDRAKNSVLSEVQFHENYLCSAQELGTNCAKTTNTQCDDKDDVRFVDSCGNLANIYDSSKINDGNYWTKIQEPSCGNSKGNKNSASCGDCDYLSGSMCKKKAVGDSVTAGNYICKDLDCKGYSGQGFDGSSTYPKHGETWCATDTITTDNNAPGSTYFKLACYNGEITKEECDSTRQKICAEIVVDETSGFKTANCKANLWQSCIGQNNSADCNDINVRDCTWVEQNGYYFSDGGLKNDVVSGNPTGMCVPKYQPGFERDGSDNVIGGDVCAMSSAVCYVEMQKGVGGDWYCSDKNSLGISIHNNCSCISDANGNYDSGKTWGASLNNICVQIGDCGKKTNYLGILGYPQADIIKIINASANGTA
jgi:hypothetical protein